MDQPAILALADGTIFRGRSVGAPGVAVGEVVFNTAMTGYQEILSDPSYARQLVTLTFPHIGNVGANAEDMESERMQAEGLIVRDVPYRASNWRIQHALGDWLVEQNKVGIADVDTRKLTRLLRAKGAQNACIMAGRVGEDEALAAARDFPGLEGMDLAKVVSTTETYEWGQPTWGVEKAPQPRFNVVAYDFGVKRNILRKLVDCGCRVTVVPAKTPASDVLAMQPDGVFLSNGPGDPAACDYAIEAMREFMAARMPQFGICLGHQLLGLMMGARTLKMKFGHHGANHPVQDLRTGEVMISSQNHGFALDEATLPANLKATHRSLFDGTLQGVECTDAPAFAFQGHPEASPGPHDVGPVFEHFVELMERHAPAKSRATAG
ncbi:MAG TPA: glutamine-hydrolyzing carbamoyl-phosphate synthase small subunit [Gammaproteobacteria bacterium]|nr:glutamine-hydrolyzing carbamoyl-phosphate synthase small subunit [Gammaproteobacteria bacterium]